MSHNFVSNDDDIVIVNAVRTPMCRARKGGFAEVPPSTLLQTALSGLLARTKASSEHFTPADIDDICIGNVLMPPSGFAACRMAAIMAGIPESVPMKLVNRQCSSGIESVAQIANAIATNQIKIGIGAGVESMTMNPMSISEPPPMDYDSINLHKDSQTIMDCMIPMGITSENVIKEYGLDRKELDEFAVASHAKAAAARAGHKFVDEIVPVGSVTQDDGIRPNTTMEILSKLKPVFDKDNGATTAGNASQLTDGAAAVLLMKRGEAKRRSLPIFGVYRGYAVKGVPPRIMGIGPAVAIPAVLNNVGLSKEDIDIFEINEAFASQASWCIANLQIPKEKVNPNGGAIAIGHPLGCTGTRMLTSLLYELHRTKKRFGVVSMCIGTGMGAAAVIEVEPSSSL